MLNPILTKLTTHRLDFKAKIQTSTGEQKAVLIEVQRAMFGTEQRRFRNYLGEQYMSAENIVTEEDKDIGLSILTIYFLGYNLPGFQNHGLIKNRTKICGRFKWSGNKGQKLFHRGIDARHDSCTVVIFQVRSRRARHRKNTKIV